MISAKAEHYTCVVDLLGQAGHLKEAENIMKAMPCKPDVAAWKVLLCACRVHGNVEMGEDSGSLNWSLKVLQVIMLLLAIGISCENVEQQKKERGVKKQLRCTWIEVNNEVHTFVVDDEDHPRDD
jgi:pentatricopeptide repeat protein